MVYTGNVATDGEGYILDEILETEDMKKLFVSKIPTDATDEDLKAFFEHICCGPVTSFQVIRKENAKNIFGFFIFQSSRLVDEVIFREKELVFNNTTLEVNRACPKQHYLTGAHHKTKKLFISNIPKTGICEDDLRRYFEDRHNPRFGTIESIQFIKKKDEAGNQLEENKGFGFIAVSSEHMADTMSIQHATFDFGGQTIELKKSDRDGVNNTRGGGARGVRGTRGGRGSGQVARGSSQTSSASYGGYGYGEGYGNGYDQWNYDYYSGYGVYPQYGVSSAQSQGRGGKRGAGGARGAGSARGAGGARGSRGARGTRGSRGARGAGGARGGQGRRYTPYTK